MANVPLRWLEHAVETLDDAKDLYCKYFGNRGGKRTKIVLLEAVLEEAIGDCGCYPDAIGDCGAMVLRAKKVQLPVPSVSGILPAAV